jgi:hypothetical protein
MQGSTGASIVASSLRMTLASLQRSAGSPSRCPQTSTKGTSCSRASRGCTAAWQTSEVGVWPSRFTHSKRTLNCLCSVCPSLRKHICLNNIRVHMPKACFAGCRPEAGTAQQAGGTHAAQRGRRALLAQLLRHRAQALRDRHLSEALHRLTLELSSGL